MGPATGIIAAFTTSFTMAIDGVSDYVRNISVIRKKNSRTGGSKDSIQGQNSVLTRYESQNPVSAATNYSPEQIAELAYKMAAKSIPATAEGRRRRREELERQYQREQQDLTSPGLKPGRTMSRNKALFGGNRQHSKAHDAALETGHFVDNMVEVGLKGECISCHH